MDAVVQRTSGRGWLAAIVVAHLVNVTNATTALCAAIFFWARLAHAIVFILGIPYLMMRTVIFTIAFFVLMVLAGQILLNAVMA